jgi:hypothetical protein
MSNSMAMNKSISIFMACASLMAAATSFAEGRKQEQDAAYAATRDGSSRTLREIERRVLPRMNGADYLGPEFDRSSGTYRLKFLRSGSVIWIDVDPRTGSEIGRTGR